jgi:transcriptional regulator with GAF, ATPase, and Fis domain
MIGESEAIQELKKKISIVAPSSTPVLILGETGTGKELVLNELHRQSARSKNNLVKVNCAAIQDTLLESELFGHVKGAFTDASTKKLGKLQIADRGTLVLDEISNMSYAIQAKILRVVENQQFEMVGGTESFNINTRFISASNKDLLQLIDQNKFREDLYYRLSTITLTIPPLRDRIEDIPLLVKYYVTHYMEKYIKQDIIKSVSTRALEKLYSYHWPGNVRELKSVLEQAVLFCETKQITEELIILNRKNTGDLNTFNPPTFISKSIGDLDAFDSQKLITYMVRHLSTNGYSKKMTDAIEDIELAWIEHSLGNSDYVQQEAAKLMGISKRMLCYKIKKHRQRTGREIINGLSTISKE